MFLDKSLYVRITDNQCGHSYYNNEMWWHHNPKDNEEHYSYYVRCVNRFKKLLANTESKLFCMIFVEHNSLNFEEIVEFNKKISKYTINYTLLIINHIPHQENTSHSFRYIDNIYFLNLNTKSISNGKYFNNDDDNMYLDKIIEESYSPTIS